MSKRIPQDLTAAFWTVNQAAAHFGFERKTIRKYIREGLPLYEFDMVKPDEVIAERKRRFRNQRDTRI